MSSFFFFNDTATTEIYTLSLHDALPICGGGTSGVSAAGRGSRRRSWWLAPPSEDQDKCAKDRKSTRLNSSHLVISYAVFCLKKKKISRLSPSGRQGLAHDLDGSCRDMVQ